MPTEAEVIQAQIDELDSLIASKKSQPQRPNPVAPYHHHPYNHHSNHYGYASQANNRWATRGGYGSRGRASRGGGVQRIHRNRSLVLNTENSAQTDVVSTPNQTSAVPGNAPKMISRSDGRSLQLIAPAIYAQHEQQNQATAKAIEEKKRIKLKQRDERERSKLAKHVQYYGSSSNQQTAQHEITVQDVKFLVVKDGSKLLKLQDLANMSKATPKTALVGGVLFHRSKSGNMYRAAVVRAQGKNATKKINEPCKIFSTTGTCHKGPSCRYLHEATKVAVCKDYLIKGECLAGDSCDLSHDLTPERTPMCLHFTKGRCTNPNCSYTHVHVAANAKVCPAFGFYGYCEKGATCAERHVWECPNFSNNGTCNIKGCKLPHKIKASVIRRNTATVDEDSDLSSDEDDAIDSDDVDSDDMTEEFFGGGAPSENDSISRQDDFVRF